MTLIASMLQRLNAIPPDKVMHFAVGVVFYAVCLPFTGAQIAVAAVGFIAVGKEVYDLVHKDRHTPDIWDAVVTIAGGGVGYFCTVFNT